MQQGQPLLPSASSASLRRLLARRRIQETPPRSATPHAASSQGSKGSSASSTSAQSFRDNALCLWRPRGPSETVSNPNSLAVPVSKPLSMRFVDTILFEAGRPTAWLFTSRKRGVVLRKKDEKLNVRTIMRELGRLAERSSLRLRDSDDTVERERASAGKADRGNTGKASKEQFVAVARFERERAGGATAATAEKLSGAAGSGTRVGAEAGAGVAGVAGVAGRSGLRVEFLRAHELLDLLQDASAMARLVALQACADAGASTYRSSYRFRLADLAPELATERLSSDRRLLGTLDLEEDAYEARLLRLLPEESRRRRVYLSQNEVRLKSRAHAVNRLLEARTLRLVRFIEASQAGAAKVVVQALAAEFSLRPDAPEEATLLHVSDVRAVKISHGGAVKLERLRLSLPAPGPEARVGEGKGHGGEAEAGAEAGADSLSSRSTLSSASLSSLDGFRRTGVALGAARDRDRDRDLDRDRDQAASIGEGDSDCASVGAEVMRAVSGPGRAKHKQCTQRTQLRSKQLQCWGKYCGCRRSDVGVGDSSPGGIDQAVGVKGVGQMRKALLLAVLVAAIQGVDVRLCAPRYEHRDAGRRTSPLSSTAASANLPAPCVPSAPTAPTAPKTSLACLEIADVHYPQRVSAADIALKYNVSANRLYSPVDVCEACFRVYQLIERERPSWEAHAAPQHFQMTAKRSALEELHFASKACKALASVATPQPAPQPALQPAPQSAPQAQQVLARVRQRLQTEPQVRAQAAVDFEAKAQGHGQSSPERPQTDMGIEGKEKSKDKDDSRESLIFSCKRRGRVVTAKDQCCRRCSAVLARKREAALQRLKAQGLGGHCRAARPLRDVVRELAAQWPHTQAALNANGSESNSTSDSGPEQLTVAAADACSRARRQRPNNNDNSSSSSSSKNNNNRDGSKRSSSSRSKHPRKIPPPPSHPPPGWTGRRAAGESVGSAQGSRVDAGLAKTHRVSKLHARLSHTLDAALASEGRAAHPPLLALRRKSYVPSVKL